MSINLRTLASRIAPVALVIIALAVAFFVVLSKPASLLLRLGDASAGRFVEHFQPVEVGDGKEFRWSTPGSRLVFHGSNGGEHILEMQLHGEARLSTDDPVIRFVQDKQPLASITVERPEWRVYRVLLPAGSTIGNGTDAAAIDMLSSSYFNKLRSLGAPVEWIKLTPVANTDTSPITLLRSLLLAWVMAGVAGLVWSVDRWMFGSNATRRPLRVAGITLLAGIIVCLWAWQDRYTLGWALPLRWVLGWGFVGITMPYWTNYLALLFSPDASDTAKEGNVANRRTFAGLFLTTVSTLMYQNLLSRIFSMTMWYHFAFMAISLAMFGMTLGALFVYLMPNFFSAQRARFHLALATIGYAISVIFSFLTHLSIPFSTENVIINTIPGIFAIVITYVVIAIPFVFSGICVTIVLTRFTGQVSRLYAADMIGSAIGCFVLVFVLSLTDGPTAVIVVAFLASLAAMLFSMHEKMPRIFKTSIWSAIIFAVLVVGNTYLVNQNSSPLRMLYVRGHVELRPLYEAWNSFSRVSVAGDPQRLSEPDGWGISSVYPSAKRPVRQLELGVDAGAGTMLTAFHGDLNDVEFLKYDVTSFVHYLRDNADVMVIGAGGGRDVLSALSFEQKSVLAIEFNQDTLKAAHEQFGNFTGYLDRRSDVTYVNDEARSYITRQTDKTFDVIQVSLIDTWVATTAGAFVFTENSLYTVEAWDLFMDRLNDDGILTFSRWYFRDRPGEMYRLTTLATAALEKQGVANPRDHIIIVRKLFGANDDSPHGIGTILVSKQPFTAEDLAKVNQVSQDLKFTLMLTPEQTEDPNYVALTSLSEYRNFINAYELNIKPTTDDNPYFFQMLRLRDMFDLDLADQGAMSFNQHAVRVLGILLIVILILTVLCIVVPLLMTMKQVNVRGSLPLFIFFMSIGFGYMLIEMSQMQRLSLFLGHPTYGLSVVLFTILLSSGIGSSLTQRFSDPINNPQGVYAIGTIVGSLVLFGILTPLIIDNFAALTTAWRIVLAIIIVFPLGITMGMAFPIGMKLANIATPALTPWLWGVNGAMSVCASVFVLVFSLLFGISVSFWIGFGCYVLAFVSFIWSRRRAPELSRRFQPQSQPAGD